MARSTNDAPSRLPVPAGQPAAPDPLLRQRAWAALVLGLLSVIGLFGLGNLQRGVYVVAVTLLFGAVAVWLGVTASRRARRGQMLRPRGAVGGVVFGILGLVLSGAIMVGFVIFWSQLQTYATCMNSANTVAAQQACQNQFSTSVNARISRLESGN